VRGCSAIGRKGVREGTARRACLVRVTEFSAVFTAELADGCAGWRSVGELRMIEIACSIKWSASLRLRRA
jgi:hypothetical protein